MVQSRHELLQNNYKKVIQNHPATIGTGNPHQYDDTDFLNKMFSKDHDRNGLNNYESSEVLHKSESQQILLDYTQRNLSKNRKLGSSGSARKSSAKVLISSKPNLAPIRGKDRSAAEHSKSKANTLSSKTNKDRDEEFKPTSMFSLLGERTHGLNSAEDENILLDDEVKKLDRLMLINASARYELITANSMLIDFHLNRVMRARGKAKKTLNASPSQAFTMRQNDL